jgi:uncharacterized protein (DUF3084 family)
MKQPSTMTIAIRTGLADKLTPEEIAEQLDIPRKDVMKVVYKDRHAEKKRKARVGKVRSYVRRVPRHPDKTQVVGEHDRGMRTPVKPSLSRMGLDELEKVAALIKSNSLLQNELDFVRSQFAEAYNKNQDLYNEIKDLQAVIKYLETQVVNLIKSN